jgi:CHAT domain-containing protein
VALDSDAHVAAQASLVAVAVTGARSVGVDERRVDFAAIPAAAGEVTAIAGDYGTRSQLLVDGAATEATVREAARETSVLHIASHGFFDPVNPMDSGLLLTAGADGADDDGVLHAWEVMANWTLEGSSLVVLSACDTGVGEERAGEGLIGLGRAFQYAGAQGVVASLWPVADQSTARLMRDFHQGLLAGKRPAEALHAAQRNLLRTGGHDDSAERGVGALQPRNRTTAAAHPFYWAGFEVFGQLP